jgi:cytochrome c553
MKQAWRNVVVALTSIGCVGTAHAAGEEARSLAAGCASCHQPTERTLPPLAGQSRNELVAKLRGFRDGTRGGTVMPQLAKGYTEAQLQSIAEYFAAQTSPR